MGIISSFFTFVASLNGFVVLVISLLLGFFSNFYFGFATFVLSFLVIVTSPEMNVKVGENEWKFGIPVFPGKPFFRLALGLTVIGSITFAVFGEETLKPYQDSFRLSKLQNATQQSVKVIKAGRVYYEEIGKWGSISETKGILLGEEKTTQEGELVLKFRLRGSDSSRYNGPVVWVPILMIGKDTLSKNSQTSAGVRNKSQLEIGKEWWRTLSQKPKTLAVGGNNQVGKGGVVVKNNPPPKSKETSGVVELTPREIYALNEHRAYKGKMLINLPKEFKDHSRVVLLEDFVIKTDNPRNVTVLFFGGKRGFIGEGQIVRVPKGTEFRFGGDGRMFSVVSRGDQEFSSLKLGRLN